MFFLERKIFIFALRNNHTRATHAYCYEVFTYFSFLLLRRGFERYLGANVTAVIVAPEFCLPRSVFLETTCTVTVGELATTFGEKLFHKGLL